MHMLFYNKGETEHLAISLFACLTQSCEKSCGNKTYLMDIDILQAYDRTGHVPVLT